MVDRDDDDELRPPTEEEIAASKRLRDALEDPSIDDPAADLARSLRAAYAPPAIEEAAHDAMIDDVATPEEIAAAAELREGRGNDAELMRAIAAAWSPKAISDADNRAIVAKVLGAATSAPRKSTRGGVVVRVSFGAVAGVMAIAASVFFFVGPHRDEAPLARSRSTQPLFDEPFKAGEASARIDRIAMARASDYRDNQFSKWGVR